MTTYKVGSSVNSICKSPSNPSLFAIGGREVLKILQWDESSQKIVDMRNFRGRKDVKSDMYITDIEWNKSTDQLATASTNGTVLVWNVNDTGRERKIEYKIKNERAVNSIDWNFHETSILLVGSREDIKIWDIRSPNNRPELFSYTSNGEARSVGWNPFNGSVFASALGNGTVLLFDIRNLDRPVREIFAHTEIIKTLSWATHEDNQGILATASLDRNIKFWHVEDESVEYTINTIASVGAIEWRTGHRNQIASSASLVDFNVHLWDIQTSNIPLGSLDFHQDSVTGIIFQDEDYVITSSKDGFIARHSISDFSTPYKNISCSPVSWNPINNLAFVRDPINRNISPTSAPDIRSPMEKFTSTSSTAHDYGVVNVMKPGPIFKKFGFDPVSFSYLSFNYHFRGDTISALCQHNYQEAISISKSDVAEFWKILSLLVNDEPQISSSKNQENEIHNAMDLDDLLGIDIGSFIMEDAEDHLNDDMFSNYLADELFGINSTERISSPQARRNEPVPPKETDRIEWNDEGLISDALRYHVKQGDVQTPVIACIILGNHQSLAKITDIEKYLWFKNYIRILRKLDLHNHAAEIIKFCTIPEIQRLSQISTSYETRCGECSKIVPNLPGWMCKRCSKINSYCGVCNTPVKGIYVWCQGCGHGGHSAHMKEWFKTSKQCPTGCGHNCLENIL